MGTTTRGYAGLVSELSHLDDEGRARMVDVGAKEPTEAFVQMEPATAARVAEGNVPKGDVVSTARIAGIQAAKRTAELIPLCHPLTLSFVDVEVEIDAGAGTVRLTAEARTRAETGVEMEALTACSVAALTVYDMVKAVERGVEIGPVRLLEKEGGAHDWRRPAS
jgi:cyclic pyranopterin phosphate synthase